jgi:hypothetical protein
VLGTQEFARAVALITLVCAVAGCSGGSGGSGLEMALSHVADTANTRSQILYDDTAELVQLVGRNPGSATGFGALRGWGASLLSTMAYLLPGDTGINLFNESYAVSAGSPPDTLSLLDGGQSASLVTSRMTRLGWKRSGARLIGPPSLTADPTVSQYAQYMPQVLPSGSDVVVGSSAADLGQIGTPSGPTLAADPRISGLAQCLGNVVAAGIFSGGDLGGGKPAAVAVGVSQPASSTAVPHAVVCVAWSSQAEAANYAAELRQALSSGVSPETDERYSAVLLHPSVTSVGGSQHVVEWQADTPANASLVFLMIEQVDLPALPDCGALTPLARARVPGCS